MTKLGDLAEKRRMREEQAKRRPVKRLAADRPALAWPESKLAALHWYGVTTRPGCEAALEAVLERAGLVALVPMAQRFRKVNRYTETKVAMQFPIMPRYVLIGFAGWQLDVRGQPRWRELVLDNPIPAQPVGIEQEAPSRMDGVKVAAFLMRNGLVSAADAERFMRTHKEFEEGDTVEIVEGSFAGHRGRVSVISGHMAQVLVELFGLAEYPASVPLANLERTD